MIKLLSMLWKGLNALGLFKLAHDIGQATSQGDGTVTDPALSTTDNSLSNSQKAKIGGFIISAFVVGMAILPLLNKLKK